MARLLTLRPASRLAGPEADDAAETVLRLAVLLQAGAVPARAWAHLAAADDPVARAVVAAGEDRGVADVLRDRGGAWRDIGAAWHVATTVGAPLAASLRGIAVALRDAREAADDVRVALAEPAATARLMAWLPLVALVLGVALGFDTLRVLVVSPSGIACLVVGVLLMLLSRRWTARLVRRARPAPDVPGLEAELLAIALSGGVSLARASELVAATGVRPDDDTAATLRLSATAGIPAVELLRASAALARHRVRTRGRLTAATLSSRLLAPLGVCTLPAFVLLGVAPMLLAVLDGAPLRL